MRLLFNPCQKTSEKANCPTHNTKLMNTILLKKAMNLLCGLAFSPTHGELANCPNITQAYFSKNPAFDFMLKKAAAWSFHLPISKHI